MKDAVLFDLGNTLVRYYERSEFPSILEEAITEVQKFLGVKGLLCVFPEAIWQRVKEENYEFKDYRVRPLEERLVRIFQLEALSSLKMDMFRCFMKPIFARGYCYEDTLSTLGELKSKGLKTAIVSNTPWGSPADLWREQIKRLGLSDPVDAVVFCRDVGLRKPAKGIFEFALERLQASPGQCIFVGDDPRWDLVGPTAVGIEAVLIDRRGIWSRL